MQFPNERAIEIDFVHDKKRYLRPLRGKKELIAKAVGIATRKNVRVFDATAGLGEDLWTMARLGADVVGCEREKLLAEVLLDAHRRALRDENTATIAGKVAIYHADAVEFLQGLPNSECPDTIFLDPMFPESKKTALPRMEMQLFRDWLGKDGGINELFEVAMEKARWRVVVKRAIKSPPVLEKVIHQFKGTSIRYDLYQPRNLSR